MKVVLFTEGGTNFGFGHVVRCGALQEAFEENGISSELIINADNTVSRVLDNVNYRLCDWLDIKEKILNTIDKGDIVFVDSYLANSDFYKEISKIARRIVCLDDHKRMDYPRGIVLNSAIYAEDLDYSHDDGNVYLLGTQYISLRKEFWDVSQKKNTGSVRKILITFGGMDYSDLIQKIVDYFKDKFHYTFDCVDFKKKKTDSSSFLRAIFESDLCISGGGQTVYNLARCGIPTIGVSFSEDQQLNLKWWGRTKFLKFIGGHKDDNLFKKIENFLHGPNLGKFLYMGKTGREYIDGQGARRVVKAVLLNI